MNQETDVEQTKKPKVTQEMRDLARQTAQVQQNETMANQTHEEHRQAEQEQSRGLER